MAGADKERDIVLFLGAGFSAGVGLPTMARFGEASLKQLAYMDREGHKENKLAGELLKRAGRMFCDFQEWCRKSSDYVECNTGNMEEVFCIAEMLKAADQADVRLHETDVSLDDLILNIKLWLWNVFRFIPALHKRDRRPNDDFMAYWREYQKYKPFFRMVRRVVRRLTVITTNYDLHFEFGAWKNGTKCRYPLPMAYEYSVERLIDGERDLYLNVDTSSANSLNPLVCKLHGSVNYFEDECGKLRIAADIAKHNPPDKVGKSRNGLKQDIPAILLVDSSWILREKKLSPAIIPPTYAKLEQRPWLRETWRAAMNALIAAERIVFIGYGFPDSDGFMKAMIQAAMSGRDPSRKLDIMVVDPSREVQERYARLFKPVKITQVERQFVDALDEIEKAILH